MKVITNNNKSEFPKKVTCEHCKSVLEIESESEIIRVEIKGFDPRDREHFSYEIDGFECPCCQKKAN